MSERPIFQTLRSALRWETGLALLVVIIGIAGSAVSSQFFTSINIFNQGLSYGAIAIMTLPMTLIVISGEIDLSVASTLGMSSALLGFLWARHWPMLAIFVLIAVVGLAAGAINGLLVTRFGLPSLAVTIGTLALYRGIATILLGPRTVASFPVTYTTPGATPARSPAKTPPNPPPASLCPPSAFGWSCTRPRSGGPSSPRAAASGPAS